MVSSYAVTFMLLGLWMMAAALDYVKVVEAFVLWLASVGALVLALGIAVARHAPSASTLPIGVGGAVTAMGLVSYFVMGDALEIMMGMALVIFVCASLVLIIYLSRYRVEKE
jgi:hypothetical protein